MVTKSIVTQPTHALPPSPRGIESLTIVDLAFMMIINFVVFSAIGAAIYAYLPKHGRHLFGWKPHHKVLCYGCRYFGDNPHLRCALHPMTVMTEQVADCADYEPRCKVK